MKEENNGKQLSVIPLRILCAGVMYAVVYRFFTPWYLRLWDSIKRFLQIAPNKEKE